MKPRVFVFAAFLLAASVSLSAQETKENIAYSNITEFGFFTTSPKGIAIEATTVQGFSIDKIHHLGLGFGIGGCIYSGFGGAYMPLFMNYRLYFKPEKSFSPHVNAALGGLITVDGGGVYSALTMGFISGNFSFSSGVSLMLFDGDLPFGITIKCGFSF